MEKLKNFLIKELTKEPQEKKASLQDFAKRMLVGFFVMMLLLTMLSRAADSITVAKVEASNSKSGILSFEVTGSGTVQAAAEKYIELYNGVKIKDIAVKVGQPVEKGDLLFTYDLQELKKAREDKQNEYTIAELNQEKGKLNQEAAATTSETEAARIKIKRVELDLQLAKLEYETSKDNLSKDNNKKLEEAKALVTDAEDTLAETEEGKDQAIADASKEVSKAEQNLKDLNVDRVKTETVLNDYKTAALNSTINLSELVKPETEETDTSTTTGGMYFGTTEYFTTIDGIDKSFMGMITKLYTQTAKQLPQNNKDALSLAELAIFKQYYGEETFNSHAEEVRKAELALTRAKEDYMLNFAESGGSVPVNQKAACIRAYQDAKETLNKLTKKDQELSAVILAYGVAVQSKVDANITATYSNVFSMLYKEDDKKQRAIVDANDQINTAQNKLTQAETDWDRKVKKSERELDKAEESLSDIQEVCDKIKNQTYDYSTDLKVQESQVTAAERALEDAKAELKKAEQNDEASIATNRTKEQISEIDTKINELDLKKKKEALDEIDKIINNKGKVKSPVSGILLTSEIKVGGSTTGTEKVSISTDNYSFSAKVGKDDVKHLAMGDDINITLENGRRSVDTTIESIGPEDAQGMSEIAAILPEGEYGIGAAATFNVSKKSNQYNQTIPLQAVRMDSNQVYYILVIQESNTSLGDEMIATRRNIKILDRDYQAAAFEGAIGMDENIIVTSSKSIEEGDRVRINEESK